MVPKTFIGAVGTELNQSSGNRSTESSCLRRTFSEAYAQLVRLAHVRIGNRADAEDLVQEALVRTFSRPRRLAEACPPQPAPRGQERNRLQQVSLAGAVGSGENDRAGVNIEPEVPVTAKIG